jgi:hypothetical protein
MNDKPEVAVKWLEEAALQAASSSSMTNDTTTIALERTQEKNIEQVLKNVVRKLPPGFRDLDDSEDDQDDGREYRLGRIPPKTRDPEKYKTVDDDINYGALCRGKDLLPPRERALLYCHYADLNHPFYKLGPMKVELAHRPPHSVVIFHEFMTDAESNEIVDIASPRLMRASIGSDKVVSEMRVAKNAWLEDGIPVVDRIAKRINQATGLQTSRKFDLFGEGKLEEYELLQVGGL